MKTAIVTGLALLTLTPLAQAAGLPDGSFKGEGLWKSAKQSGGYEVTSQIQGQTVTTNYKLPDGSAKQYVMEMKPTQNGFFELSSDKTVIGQGYCLEHVALCHYELHTPNVSLEETLTIQNEKLYKFGSKTEGGQYVMWQEALSK